MDSLTVRWFIYEGEMILTHAFEGSSIALKEGRKIKIGCSGGESGSNFKDYIIESIEVVYDKVAEQGCMLKQIIETVFLIDC